MLSKLLLPNSFSKADVKLAIMSLLGFLFYGLAGLGVIFLMKLLSYVAIGRDFASSHGISGMLPLWDIDANPLCARCYAV